MKSPRAKLVYLRTYSREKSPGQFETFDETLDRVIGHQRWLWERALGRKLISTEEKELGALRWNMSQTKIMLAGRTMWLGGTPISKEREASQFNCSFLNVETVHDVVDAFWLLLNGCGVGFRPITGTLNGFTRKIEDVRTIRSRRSGKGGQETNSETYDPSTRTWTIVVGDSGEAWAKAVGKLIAGKWPAKSLVFDLSNIRPGGSRLSRYGWISSGDAALSDGLEAIARILNNRTGRLLKALDIIDILNWCGVIQTGRRGAEIALLDFGHPEWESFADAKYEYWKDNPQRAQSNNSLVFWEHPGRGSLVNLFDRIVDCGGSEPGFINGEAAVKRAPWFSGVNPCGEILLGNKSFCNLVEVNLSASLSMEELLECVRLVSRANYRQTLVDLRDGILQTAWHEQNEYLRLCGVGLTGIVTRPDLSSYDFKLLRNAAIRGAYSMADEVGSQLPKNVTTIKPSGTMSKLMDTTEGAHKPLGRYIFNNINFNKHDPLVDRLKMAGYRVFENPLDKEAVCVTFPIEWSNVQFSDNGNGKWVNRETAIDQLNRYKQLMDYYVDHNCSNTISYEVDEIGDIVDWLDKNWDHYVGVTFLPRNGLDKTAADLGYLYLPQEVVDEAEFSAYTNKLRDVELTPGELLQVEECAGGTCPIR